MRYAGREVLAAVVMTALLGGCNGRSRAPAAAELAAVQVSFADMEGIRAALDLRRRAGRPLLVNFWATWCVPCVEELPDLAAISREFSGRGPDVLGISLDAWVIGSEPEAEEMVREALARSGATYGNLIYRGDQDPLLDGFDLPGPIPYSILYDGGGRKVMTWSGKVDVDELRRAAAGLR